MQVPVSSNRRIHAPTNPTPTQKYIAKLPRGGREAAHCFRSDILSAVTASGFAGEFQDDWLAALSVGKDGKSWRYFGAGLFRSAPQDGKVFSCFRSAVTKSFGGCQRWRPALPRPSNHGKSLFSHTPYSMLLSAVGSDKHAPDAERPEPPPSTIQRAKPGRAVGASAPLTAAGEDGRPPTMEHAWPEAQGRAAMATRRSVSAVRRWYHALAVVLAVC